MQIVKNAPEGNAWAVMSTVKMVLVELGRGDEFAAARSEMMSGDYENLLEVATRVTDGIITFTD